MSTRNNFCFRIKIAFLMVLSFNFAFSNVVKDDSLFVLSDSCKSENKEQKLLSGMFIPFFVITSGLVINNSNFEKEFQSNINEIFSNDDPFLFENILIFIPTIETYSFDLIGIEAQNHWFDQTKYMVIANLTTLAITLSLKELINKQRPNGNNNLSMPSGHSSLAFTNAAITFEEFSDSSPVLASSAYLFSTGTAASRVIHNNHWLSDVMIGMGIGILVTKFVYYFEPFKNFNPFKTSKNISIVPQFGNDYYGMYLSSSF